MKYPLFAAALLALAVTACDGKKDDTPPPAPQVDMQQQAEPAAATDASPAETNPAETNPAETNPAEANPAEANPADAAPAADAQVPAK
ncbi:MAG: hypothetical protein FWF12_12205 [Betaproteobacteria bacterium]|nr:hypothetical protein [Betaproteobacteria bacterium]